MILGQSNTSWGQPTKEVDARALRMYRSFLTKIGNVGEVVYFALLTVFACASIWLLAFANLENIIFYDGTAHTCVLDGDTQEVIYVQ